LVLTSPAAEPLFLFSCETGVFFEAARELLGPFLEVFVFTFFFLRSGGPAPQVFLYTYVNSTSSTLPPALRTSGFFFLMTTFSFFMWATTGPFFLASPDPPRCFKFYPPFGDQLIGQPPSFFFSVVEGTSRPFFMCWLPPLRVPVSNVPLLHPSFFLGFRPAFSFLGHLVFRRVSSQRSFPCLSGLASRADHPQGASRSNSNSHPMLLSFSPRWSLVFSRAPFYPLPATRFLSEQALSGALPPRPSPWVSFIPASSQMWFWFPHSRSREMATRYGASFTCLPARPTLGPTSHYLFWFFFYTSPLQP